MKGNRKVSKRMSRISMHTMHVGAVLLMLFVMGILNLLASSSCDQLTKAMNEGENRLKQCEAELERATARWDAMKSDDNLDRALVKWGISMHYPKENQIVRLDKDGNLEPGQTSVALARARSQNSFSASVSSPGEVYSTRRTRHAAYSAGVRQGESARQRIARTRRR